MKEMINGPTNIVLWFGKSTDLMKRKEPISSVLIIHSSTTAILVHFERRATLQREGFFSARHDLQGKAEKRYNTVKAVTAGNRFMRLQKCGM